MDTPRKRARFIASGGSNPLSPLAVVDPPGGSTTAVAAGTPVRSAVADYDRRIDLAFSFTRA